MLGQLWVKVIFNFVDNITIFLHLEQMYSKNHHSLYSIIIYHPFQANRNMEKTNVIPVFQDIPLLL